MINIQIVLKEPTHDLRLSEEQGPSVDAISILADVCTALDESNSAEFIVGGFGEARWPVDVNTDLSTFLEQLPQAISAVEAFVPFTIEFYEQGLERVMRFEPDSDEYVAHAESSITARSPWSPPQPTERIPLSSLRQLLVNAFDTFMALIDERLPEVAKHPAIKDWARAVTAV